MTVVNYQLPGLALSPFDEFTYLIHQQIPKYGYSESNHFYCSPWVLSQFFLTQLLLLLLSTQVILRYCCSLPLFPPLFSTILPLVTLATKVLFQILEASFYQSVTLVPFALAVFFPCTCIVIMLTSSLFCSSLLQFYVVSEAFLLTLVSSLEFC